MPRPRFRLRSLMLAVAAVAVGLGGLAWLGRLGLLGIVARVAIVPLVPIAAGFVVFGFDRLLGVLDRGAAADLQPEVAVEPATTAAVPVPIFARRTPTVLPGVLASGLPSR